MHKPLLLTLAALSWPMIAHSKQSGNPSPFVQAAQKSYESPYKELRVIQEDASQQRCIRYISEQRPTILGVEKVACAIEHIPVTEATKAIIAEKLKKRSQETVYYSDCIYSNYQYFVRSMVDNDVTRYITIARLDSHTISEIREQEIYMDACKNVDLEATRISQLAIASQSGFAG